jgi:hypothetical protein
MRLLHGKIATIAKRIGQSALLRRAVERGLTAKVRSTRNKRGSHRDCKRFL